MLGHDLNLLEIYGEPKLLECICQVVDEPLKPSLGMGCHCSIISKENLSDQDLVHLRVCSQAHYIEGFSVRSDV